MPRHGRPNGLRLHWLFVYRSLLRRGVSDGWQGLCFGAPKVFWFGFLLKEMTIGTAGIAEARYQSLSQIMEAEYGIRTKAGAGWTG